MKRKNFPGRKQIRRDVVIFRLENDLVLAEALNDRQRTKRNLVALSAMLSNSTDPALVLKAQKFQQRLDKLQKSK